MPVSTVKSLLYKSLRAKFSLLFLAASLFSYSQDSLLLPGKFTTFSVDNLGNSYTVVKKDTLFKYSKTNVMQNYNYVNSSLGEIDQIDASNPLQLIVLHNDVSTLVFLDVTLREVRRIRLQNVQIFSNPIAFAQNADGTIWVFDDVNASIVRLNPDGEQIDKSLSLIQQLDFVPEVANMQANNEYIILHDEDRGFIVLDQFAEFIKYMPMQDVSHFELVNNHILFSTTTNNQLQAVALTIAGVQTIPGVQLQSDQFKIQQEKLYQLTEKGIYKSSLQPKVEEQN